MINLRGRLWGKQDDLKAIAVILAGSLVAAWIVTRLLTMGRDLTAEETARDRLAAQVQQLGATPVAGPPGSRGEPGPAGSPGRDAPTPDVNAIASMVAGLVTPIPGPSGPPGKDATPMPGPSGPPGAKGADSTVAGPSGPPGPSSTIPGPSGAPGANGEPPYSWTFTYHGSEYTCSRVANFDPSQPAYQCEESNSDPSNAVRR